MASSWGTSWGTSWGLAWEVDLTPPEDVEGVGRFAADGSLRIATDTGSSNEYDDAKGIYSLSGAVRFNLTDTRAGLYARDGAYRGVLSTDEGSPAPGIGLYTPDGALRLTSSTSAYYDQPGAYAKDGSLKVTIINE